MTSKITKVAQVEQVTFAANSKLSGDPLGNARSGSSTEAMVGRIDFFVSSVKSVAIPGRGAISCKRGDISCRRGARWR